MENKNFEASIWEPEIQISQVCYSLQDFQASSTENPQCSGLIIGDWGKSDIFKASWKTMVLDISVLSLSHPKPDFYNSSFSFFFLKKLMKLLGPAKNRIGIQSWNTAWGSVKIVRQ